ncbi:uncharacterized protein TRIADDRAFT_26341 [Trichoplax adhaerens]|uniref:GMP synthase (glutamine-hydrolyzing) n=1 Tax=Trichoplax adhaerens TaxID=10228 RepID=B3S031_TRIAD|nr:hypothetical protein TRIADDRAFT_26341 [Trichoplax adhaerens]EDV23935.1 hypothetical protein TRIADDRAFT_26341 [Trichoplax adhaerens]|eukprot:XP_002113461.1 hypothetical protein TRIADDRAFT_26341 [Trichoplax adhaerens]
MTHKVALLDAGAQYGKVIDRRIRDLNVETEMVPLDITATSLVEKGYRAIIISGGPNSVYSSDALIYDPNIFSIGIPILGICYGMQLVNLHFGGTVTKGDVREDGQFTIDVDPDCLLFSGLSKQQNVLLTHGDSVDQVANTFKVIATSGDIVTAIGNDEKHLYGVQFHPEVDLTEKGSEIFRNFLFKIAKCPGNFTMINRQQQCIDNIKQKVRDKKALVLVSGGVDSAVCAALLHKALGSDRVIALHIDNGFMRKNESDDVKISLRKIGLDIEILHSAYHFYTSHTSYPIMLEGIPTRHITDPLVNVYSPEEKRHIIGDTFVRVANEYLKNLGIEPQDIVLAQGTLRPDLIESASKEASSEAHVIKTHHNDTDLVRQLRLQNGIIEPLQDFHKDEVRALGIELGLPPHLINRHPFPGPGLAIRVICADERYVTNEFGETCSLLQYIVDFARAQQRPHAHLTRISGSLSLSEQEFLLTFSAKHTISATLLPIKTVGVQGDRRSYSYVAGLSSDEPPVWEGLFKLAKLIPRICHDVNRVVYVNGPAIVHPVHDITPTTLSNIALSTLREADEIVNSALRDYGYKISQAPVVLIPIHFDRGAAMKLPSTRRSIVFRPFVTNDFMTGVAAIPGKHIPEEVVFTIFKNVEKIPGISRVLYDMTSKPPGTTEWE